MGSGYDSSTNDKYMKEFFETEKRIERDVSDYRRGILHHTTSKSIKQYERITGRKVKR